MLKLVEVKQRLTHAHKNDIGNMLVINLLRPIIQQDIFINDFAVMQIADETHSTCGAERTVQRTPDLRGKARRDALLARNQHALVLYPIIIRYVKT